MFVRVPCGGGKRIDFAHTYRLRLTWRLAWTHKAESIGSGGLQAAEQQARAEPRGRRANRPEGEVGAR